MRSNLDALAARRSDAASASSCATSRFAYGRDRRCSRASTWRSRPASSSRSPARTAAARRRSCGSRSGSSGRAPVSALLYGEPAHRVLAPRDARLPRPALAARDERARDRARGRVGGPPRGRRPARPAAPSRPRDRRRVDRARRASRPRRIRRCTGCPAGSSSARSSPRRSPASRRCSCSTSRRPVSTPRRRRRSPRCSTGCTASCA